MSRATAVESLPAPRRHNPSLCRPNLPLVIQACAEEQLSYEYRHGATSYGAFTFCLASLLRKEPSVTFNDLVMKARRHLKVLGYDQTPQFLGPEVVMPAQVPWKTGTRAHKPPASEVPGGATPRTTGRLRPRSFRIS